MEVELIECDQCESLSRLKELKPPVKQLWCRGELRSEILKKTVAVVGSRRMSRYGRSVVEDIVPRLCGAGYSIVSGLMYGVDQLAHKKTLECGGVAIAVLGWGITRANDPESDRLADEIVAHQGVVMSEYPEETRGQLWTFPQRNRIVVGLSDAVIVVEAGIKSGTMSTVKWAKKIGTPVYAVPGSMFAPTSAGSNYMIETGMARPLNAEIMNSLTGEGTKKVVNTTVQTLSETESELVSKLTVLGPMSINELTRIVELDVGGVLATLVTLEMKGVVAEDSGVFGIV